MFGWRMALAARASLRKRASSCVVADVVRVQHLDGDAAADAGVLGQIDRAHPPLAEQRGGPVISELFPDHERHSWYPTSGAGPEISRPRLLARAAPGRRRLAQQELDPTGPDQIGEAADPGKAEAAIKTQGRDIAGVARDEQPAPLREHAPGDVRDQRPAQPLAARVRPHRQERDEPAQQETVRGRPPGRADFSRAARRTIHTSGPLRHAGEVAAERGGPVTEAAPGLERGDPGRPAPGPERRRGAHGIRTPVIAPARARGRVRPEQLGELHEAETALAQAAHDLRKRLGGLPPAAVDVKDDDRTAPRLPRTVRIMPLAVVCGARIARDDVPGDEGKPPRLRDVDQAPAPLPERRTKRDAALAVAGERRLGLIDLRLDAARPRGAPCAGWSYE